MTSSWGSMQNSSIYNKLYPKLQPYVHQSKDARIWLGDRARYGYWPTTSDAIVQQFCPNSPDPQYCVSSKGSETMDCNTINDNYMVENCGYDISIDCANQFQPTIPCVGYVTPNKKYVGPQYSGYPPGSFSYLQLGGPPAKSSSSAESGTFMPINQYY